MHSPLLRAGPGGRKRPHTGVKRFASTLALTLLAANALSGTQAAPLQDQRDTTAAAGVTLNSASVHRGSHPLPRSPVFAQRSVEAPIGQRIDALYARAVHRSDAPEKRQSHAAPRQGVVSTADEEEAAAAAPVAAPVASAVAAPSAPVASAVVAPAAQTPTVVRAAVSSAPPASAASSAPASSSAAPSSASKGSATSASATPSDHAAHTGFTLTDSDNKLYALWICVLIAGIFAGLFVILCGLRWCFFRPHSRQEDADAYLTGGAAGRGRNIRSGAKSLRKALTRRKLAGASFARRRQEGTVFVEIGDECIACPPEVAEEYYEAKRMFGGSPTGSSNGPGAPSTQGPFSWNGRAYLDQCMARHKAEEKKRAAGHGGRSNSAALNIDAWTRSTSTLAVDEKEAKDGKLGTDATGYDGEDVRPKRGLSARMAAGLRAAMRGNREDEDDELGDPEKTTDLSTFLPVITRNGAQGRRESTVARNGWSITPRPDNATDEEAIRGRGNGNPSGRRISSMTLRAAPTPITKDTPRMSNNGPRKHAPSAMQDANVASPPSRPSAAVLQKSDAQQTRMQPRGVPLQDQPSEDARNRIVTRRFPHDPVLLNGPNGQQQQQRTGTVKKVRVNSTAEPIGTPIWDQRARNGQAPGPSGLQQHSRVVSSPSFAPGQMIAHGTMPQQDGARPRDGGGLTPAPVPAGRDRLREMRAASAGYQQGGAPPKRSSTQQQQGGRSSGKHQSSQRSNRANTVRVPRSRQGAGEEVMLRRDAA